MTSDKDAEELTQEYFQRFGGFTCSWENVRQIISEILESEKALKEKLKGFESGEVCWQGDMDATIAQNLELKEHIESLANINIKAQDIIAELKEQIEEMKCCENCKHWEENCKYKTCKYLYLHVYRDEMNDDHWELAR